MTFKPQLHRVALQVPLDMNQTKLNALQKHLSHSLPKLAVGPFLVFHSDELGIGIGFAPGQVAVDILPHAHRKSFGDAAGLVNEVFNLLLMEPQGTASVELTAIADFPEVHAGGALLAQTGGVPRILSDHLPGITGVGLRYLYRDGDLHGDFKVEPIYIDPQKFWTQLSVNLGEMPIETALSQGDHWADLFWEKLLPGVTDHFVVKG